MSHNFRLTMWVLPSLLFILAAPANSQLPENWEKSVVMVERKLLNPDGTVGSEPHGTGFLFYDSTLGGVFLVTNKHLLQNRDMIFIRYKKVAFDPKKDSTRYHREACPLVGKDSKPLWKWHPNPQVDIAAVKLNPTSVPVDIVFFRYPWFKYFDDLVVGEEVYFFGFPFGVLGVKGKGDFPILRSGIVSFKSYELTNIPFLDSAMFLVDGFAFQGNSGSPVLSKNKPALVGIISGHLFDPDTRVVQHTSFFVNKAGETTFVQTRPDTIVFRQNTGLAEAICADRIKETLEQFRLRDSLQKK